MDFVFDMVFLKGLPFGSADNLWVGFRKKGIEYPQGRFFGLKAYLWESSAG